MKELTAVPVDSGTTVHINTGDIPAYYNTNFTQASFDNCVKLEELNLGGLQNANRAFDFTPNIYLKKLYTKGSGITGITFAKRGRLQEVHLNALSSLYMNSLSNLETFEMESYANLTSLTVENCPVVDTYSMTKGAADLARVRLLGINWDVPVAAYDVLMRLHNIGGIGDDGYATDNGVLIGTVNFISISPTKYDAIVTEIPTIEFSYGQFLEEYTVTFKNYDGTVLWSEQVEDGGTATDPVKAGYIAKPTRPDDESYSYVYYKWDVSLSNITTNTVVTATYLTNDKYYTVDWVDRFGNILQTNTVKAHGSCSYTGPDIVDDEQIWVGWQDDPADVVSDMTIRADYLYPTLPGSPKDMTQYDYLYSDVEGDSMAYTRDEFVGILLSNSYKNYFAVGDKIKMTPQGRTITDTSIEFRLEGFNHYKLADSEAGEFAKTSWAAVGILNLKRQMQTTATNAGGYENTLVCKFLDEDFPMILSTFWKSIIKQVLVRSIGGDSLTDIVEMAHYFYILSYYEVGLGGNASEVDNGAEVKVFPIYTSNTQRIRKTDNGTGTASDYWLRTPDTSGSSAFRNVASNGSGNTNAATSSLGVAPGFSI